VVGREPLATHDPAKLGPYRLLGRHDEFRARVQAKADRPEAAAGYGALDERLLREHAPIVPLFNERHFSLYGPRLGGLSVGRVLGSVAVERAHVLR
jgi:hypothetical protein